MQMTAGQCRAARGYLGWSQTDLAEHAKVSRAMIADFEGGKRRTHDAMRNAVQDVLEAAGVEFPERAGGKAAIVFADKAEGAGDGDAE